MTPEKIEELVRLIYEQALQGDMKAAKLILSYSVGQPRPAVDPDRLDVDEVDLFGKQARTPEEFDRILYSPTARMMCTLLQTMVPGFEKEALGKLAAGIQEMDERDRMTAGGAGEAVRSQAEPGNEEETCRQETERSKPVQPPRSEGTGGQSRQWHPGSGAEKESNRAGRAGQAARSQAEPGNEEEKARSGNGNVRERVAAQPDSHVKRGEGQDESGRTGRSQAEARNKQEPREAADDRDWTHDDRQRQDEDGSAPSANRFVAPRDPKAVR
jgi:hypothetical protein